MHLELRDQTGFERGRCDERWTETHTESRRENEWVGWGDKEIKSVTE